MASLAYGLALSKANHTLDEADRIPPEVRDYLIQLAKTTSEIAMGGELDLYRGAAQVGAYAAGVDPQTALNMMLLAEDGVDKLNDAFDKFRNSEVVVHEDGTKNIKRAQKETLKKQFNLPENRKRGADGLMPIEGVNQKMPRITIKMGKNENSALQQEKSIHNMLKMACGNSSAIFEFNGIMTSKQGSRATTFMCFRHNMGSDETPHQYTDLGTQLNFLEPIAGDTKIPGYEHITGAESAINDNNPYHVHRDLSTWFHPMGRSKFEDTAWNMNKLKHLANNYLGESGSGVGAPIEDEPSAHIIKTLAINNDVSFQPGQYARTSSIYSNNINASASKNDPEMPYPYQQHNYNMVFNKGEVSFDFCNKGDGPTQCEIIVYKVKRNTDIVSYDFDDYKQTISGVEVEDLSGRGIPKMLHPAIEEGVNEQYIARKQTGTINGNTDPTADIFTHPGKKLYPQSRFTRQSILPFKEHQRVPFTMKSGGRRTVCIKFGGDVYDPANVKVANNLAQGFPTGADLKIPILDEHSFIVCLSIHGVSATRVYGDANERLGDIYAPARLEWKALYSENIGAAQFTDGATKLRMNSRTYKFPGSTGLITDAAGNSAEEAAVILPLNSIVRTSNGDASVKLDGKQGMQPATIPWTVRDYYWGTYVQSDQNATNSPGPDPGWDSTMLPPNYLDFGFKFESLHNGTDYYSSDRFDDVPDPSVKWVEWGTAPNNTWVNIGWHHTKVKPNPLYVSQSMWAYSSPFMYIQINKSQIMLRLVSCICKLFGYEIEIEIEKDESSSCQVPFA